MKSLWISNCYLFLLLNASYQVCQGQPYSHLHHVILNRNQTYYFTYWCLPTLCSGSQSLYIQMHARPQDKCNHWKRGRKKSAAESPGKEENEVHPIHRMLPRERCNMYTMWMIGPTKNDQGHPWSSLAVFHLQETSLQVKYSGGHNPVIGQTIHANYKLSKRLWPTSSMNWPWALLLKESK